MQQFVSLEPSDKGKSEPTTIDTLEKAINTLGQLGIYVNWSLVTGVEMRSNHLVVFMYEGWIYKHSFERLVNLPFSTDSVKFETDLKKLLEKIFAPFLFENPGYRNIINVTPNPRDQGHCFFISLVLKFLEEKSKEGEKLRVIQEALNRCPRWQRR
ncbi:hypothetical protein ACFL0A_02000 [Patescibacteria group bacterium]